MEKILYILSDIIQKPDGDLLQLKPERATPLSKGLDIKVISDDIIKELSEGLKLLHTGIWTAANFLIDIEIRARSSIFKRGILLHNGTIDADYRDEVRLLVTTWRNPDSFAPFPRFAQMILHPEPDTIIFFNTVNLGFQPYIFSSHDNYNQRSEQISKLWRQFIEDKCFSKREGGFGSTGD